MQISLYKIIKSEHVLISAFGATLTSSRLQCTGCSLQGELAYVFFIKKMLLHTRKKKLRNIKGKPSRNTFFIQSEKILKLLEVVIGFHSDFNLF